MKFVLGFFLFFTSFGAQALTVPAFSDQVVDQAGLMDGRVREKLAGALRSIYEKGGPQLAILTVNSIGDEPIENAAMQVAQAWKMGTDKKDNGILLFVAQKERRIRIEVGQGVEGDLTDAYSRRIIDDIMVPLFRQGDYSSAFLLAADGILKRMTPPILLEDYLTIRHPQGQTKLKKNWVHWLVFVVIFLVFAFGGGGGRRGRRGAGSNLAEGALWGMLLGGGGGRGGGGFGGGGFGGGGGGGFSGGGASGSW